jgi:hypothetical protein
MRSILCLLILLSTIGYSRELKRFALFAGANNGGPDRAQLRYADKDAQTLENVLKTMGGLASENSIRISQPTPKSFLAALNKISSQIQKSQNPNTRTELIVYYSGHADDQGLRMKEELLPYDVLRNHLEKIPSDLRITMLDACASGAITRIKGGQRRNAFLVDESSDMKGFAFLTSSSDAEAAQESDNIKASFFSHSLNSGLRGAADFNNDGKVTLSELYQFAYHETLSRTKNTKGGAQHATYEVKMSGKGDVILTDLKEVSAGIVLSKELHGRFYIRDKNSNLIAELNKPAGRLVEIGLEGGSYSIYSERDDGLFLAQIQVKTDQRIMIQDRQFSQLDKESTRIRGIQKPDFSEVDRKKYDVSFGVLNDKENPYHGMQIGLLGNNTDSISSGSQIGLFYNNSKGHYQGFQASVVLNRSQKDMHGLQLVHLLNLSQGNMEGIQIAGLANHTSKEVAGVQAAGLVNIGMDSLKGVQAAGLLNYADGGVDGVQAAGILNLAPEGINGVQVAGISNIARGENQNVQVAGVANFAGKLSGPQISAVLNIADSVGGAQISTFNFAKEVKGVQLGIVAINGSVEGASFGLFHYSHEGPFHIDFSTDELGFQHFNLSSGSKYLYTRYLFAQRLRYDDKLRSGGLGVGSQIPIGSSAIIIELDQLMIDIPEKRRSHQQEFDLDMLSTLRVGYTLPVTSWLWAEASLTANYFVDMNHDQTLIPDHVPSTYMGRFGRTDQYMWPGVNFGFRLGRF